MDVQQKLTRAFFICFALLMLLGAHYFQHNQGGSGLELAQNNVVWIFFSCLIGLGLWKVSEQQKFIYSRFTILFLIAVALFCVPILYPNNELAEQSYTRLIGLFAGFLLFLSLQQFHFKRLETERLLLLIVGAGLLQACYSLMQDYLLPAQNIFGYDVGYGRPYGIFQQPNVLASFMATTLILSGYLLQQISNKKVQAFLLLTTLLNAWVITLTMSRTGYLGSVIALLLFLPWAWQCNKKKLTIFMLAIALGTGIAMLKGDALKARNVDNLSEGGARLNHYSNSWQMIKEKPLLGYGYGGFEKHYLLFNAEQVKNNKSKPEYANLTHPHNDMLFWAVEGGILPLFAMLLLIASFLNLLRAFKFTHALALTSLVIPIILHTQTEYPLYHSALHWLVLIVLVFYIDNQTKLTQQKSFRLTFGLRVSAILVPLFTTIFMLSNLYTIAKITEYERSKEPNIMVLMDIVNPLVFADRFNFHLTYFRLVMAIQRKDAEEIQKIIAWTNDTVKETPRSYFYIILYHAYMSSGQSQKAQEILGYARYLYPLDNALANIDKQIKANNAPISDASSTGSTTSAGQSTTNKAN
ncbi:Wzy polymerase domain-containing protein [Psychromonas sp. MME2]|uniref:PglL family O-oligosaccharyltransferase n=1 Tax=unclassified Psychromonas TaxID=2614957 RepID=UPI00339C7E2A